MPSAIPKRPEPLRAEKSYEDEKYFSDSEVSSSDEEDDNNNETSHLDAASDDDDDGSIDSDEDVSMTDAPPAQNTASSSLRTIDFGTLASAQSSLDRDRRRSQNPRHASITGANTTTRTDADKVNNLRARLSELKALKSAPATSSTTSSSHDPTRSTTSSRARASLSGANTTAPGPRDRDRDSNRAPSRSSKHAPMEQSSKHQVTRRRAVTDISSNPTHARDPRFSSGYASSLSAPDPASTALAHNYAFLADYRQTEVNVLKAEMKAIKAKAAKRKSRALLPEEEVTVQRLRVAVNRHENRVKSEKDKERAQEVVRRHRREEREKVEGGKRPYYLKESEVKKRVLTEKFEGMKAREKDRAMKRRQKKISERERRSMPGDRRGG